MLTVQINQSFKFANKFDNRNLICYKSIGIKKKGAVMKISTKVRYAMRAMVELASHEGDSPVLISSIAENQNLSKKYLETLLVSLKSSGLVRSVRGKQGGYALAKPAEDITAEDIYRAVEGDLMLVDCLGDHDSCERTLTCPAMELWEEINDAVRDILKNKTLKQLAERAAEKKLSAATMYYI